MSLERRSITGVGRDLVSGPDSEFSSDSMSLPEDQKTPTDVNTGPPELAKRRFRFSLGALSTRTQASLIVAAALVIDVSLAYLYFGQDNDSTAEVLEPASDNSDLETPNHQYKDLTGLIDFYKDEKVIELVSDCEKILTTRRTGQEELKEIVQQASLFAEELEKHTEGLIQDSDDPEGNQDALKINRALLRPSAVSISRMIDNLETIREKLPEKGKDLVPSLNSSISKLKEALRLMGDELSSVDLDSSDVVNNPILNHQLIEAGYNVNREYYCDLLPQEVVNIGDSGPNVEKLRAMLAVFGFLPLGSYGDTYDNELKEAVRRFKLELMKDDPDANLTPRKERPQNLTLDRVNGHWGQKTVDYFSGACSE